MIASRFNVGGELHPFQQNSQESAVTVTPGRGNLVATAVAASWAECLQHYTHTQTLNYHTIMFPSLLAKAKVASIKKAYHVLLSKAQKLSISLLLRWFLLSYIISSSCLFDSLEISLLVSYHYQS